MKVAIIGANGFIGNRLVEIFHLNGLHEVVPIVRKPSSLALPARFAIDWRIGNALDTDSLTAALTGCDAVVHSAIGDPRQIEAMPAILAAAAARAHIKRVVYLSTASVHGQNPPAGTDESSPLHTKHVLEYNNAKVRAEQSFHRECSIHHLEGFALRPGVVFGPRSRWITDLADDLRQGRSWFINGGNGICNSLYVDNLVSAVNSALTTTPEHAGSYLVGDAETVTWREFYHVVASGIGISPHSIPDLPALPDFTPSTSDRIKHFATTPAVQSVLPLIPKALKRTAKTLLSSSRHSSGVGAWTLPSVPSPRVTHEQLLLQQCQVKLPHHRAATRIGYSPPVSFGTGMDKSITWYRHINNNYIH